MKKKIAILGSTGSIGKILLNIVKKNNKIFKITLLTANKDYKTLFTQAKKYGVKNLIITNDVSYNGANCLKLNNNGLDEGTKHFLESQTFINKVAEISESEGHHPDISFGWGYAEIKITTHAIEGLSENDFILAAKIDQLINV